MGMDMDIDMDMGMDMGMGMGIMKKTNVNKIHGGNSRRKKDVTNNDTT